MATSETLVLAGDVGGTKTELALVSGAPHQLEIRHQDRFVNRRFDSLEALVREFLAEAGVTPDSACFGVAGAVIDGTCAMPNLDWRLTEAGLAEALDIDAVILINDLEATAEGIETLPSTSIEIINPGKPLSGGIAPKLLPTLRDGFFLHAFVDKGRFGPLLQEVPVRVILEPATALRGAAAHALANRGRRL